MELTTFSIPAFRKASIQTRLEKLARKAAKNGNPDIKFEFGESKMCEINTEYGLREIEFIDIVVSGEAPLIAGWEFLSRVELLEGDENLVHQVPGASIITDKKYRTHSGYCDHCNSLRRRNDVFVLSDGTEQIAVGRQCLREFLGIDDPKSIVNRAQFFEELKNIENEEFEDFGSFGYKDIWAVLTLAAANIRLNGYVSKAKQSETGEPTTGDMVSFGLRGIPGYEVDVKDEDKAWAKKTVEYFRGQDTFGNDYMDNLRVLMKQDIIKKEHINLVASSVITAQRQLAPRPETKESNFVGDVKTRLKGIDMVFERVIYLGTGTFGPSFLHLMKDDNGNAFSWITGNKLELDSGSKIKVDATVKTHKIYNGVKQTVITRAKVTS